MRKATILTIGICVLLSGCNTGPPQKEARQLAEKRFSHQKAKIKYLLAFEQFQNGQIAKARDYGRMEWWVLDGNASAIRFYRSLGSEAMKDWTVFRLTGKSLLDLAEQPSSAGT